MTDAFAKLNVCANSVGDVADAIAFRDGNPMVADKSGLLIVIAPRPPNYA